MPRAALSPVGSEPAGDAQHVHHTLRLQLPTADGGGDEAAGAADPSAGGQRAQAGGWGGEWVGLTCAGVRRSPPTCSGQ